MNYMKKCSCAYCNGDIYKVDVNSFARVRRRGVSGILRVKNDAEFLAESIDSCIDALDELIIVYNDCSDESPAIIKKRQSNMAIRFIIMNMNLRFMRITLQQMSSIL